jgi:hypothetical protein
MTVSLSAICGKRRGELPIIRIAVRIENFLKTVFFIIGLVLE